MQMEQDPLCFGVIEEKLTTNGRDGIRAVDNMDIYVLIINSEVPISMESFVCFFA